MTGKPTPEEIMREAIDPDRGADYARICWGGVVLRQIQALTNAGYQIVSAPNPEILTLTPTSSPLLEYILDHSRASEESKTRRRWWEEELTERKPTE